ncbi:RecX family transcriptional regulator [Sphingomonas sp. EC-HK361]|uniref:regulatory protein RecX n=1 Tax=Sphingomonas sp. EC-HK361 TaxID=2038397 RepID=UPI0012528ECD|nr:RecX family transcriptional regulator [Sphingomonas sp. EC-HK361]VVT04606.1 RecX family transcriptional regulator [Sphingomonas sp. EC-HK361]
MTRNRKPGRAAPPPLDAAALERLALRYVERFATSRAKLADYLRRKIRERGWEGEAADPDALAARLAELGYIDDRAFAEARARSLGRRGLGARRVQDAWRQAGIEAQDTAAIRPDVDERAAETALAFARRKRIGPFALAASDRPRREKQLAAMLRAGHGFAIARAIVDAPPGASTEDIAAEFAA